MDSKVVSFKFLQRYNKLKYPDNPVLTFSLSYLFYPDARFIFEMEFAVYYSSPFETVIADE